MQYALKVLTKIVVQGCMCPIIFLFPAGESVRTIVKISLDVVKSFENILLFILILNILMFDHEFYLYRCF